MSKKQILVLKLDIHDQNTKEKVMKAISSTGFDSVNINMMERKVTIVGYVDPASIVTKLRKICHTEIVSVVPVPPARPVWSPAQPVWSPAQPSAQSSVWPARSPAPPTKIRHKEVPGRPACSKNVTPRK